MQEVIIYRNPLEAAIWSSLMNGGFVVVLVFILAALVGVGVYTQIERLVSRSRRRYGYTTARTMGWTVTDFLSRHNGKISIAVSLISLYLVHLANIKGWI